MTHTIKYKGFDTPEDCHAHIDTMGQPVIDLASHQIDGKALFRIDIQDSHWCLVTAKNKLSAMLGYKRQFGLAGGLPSIIVNPATVNDLTEYARLELTTKDIFDW